MLPQGQRWGYPYPPSQWEQPEPQTSWAHESQRHIANFQGYPITHYESPLTSSVGESQTEYNSMEYSVTEETFQSYDSTSYDTEIASEEFYPIPPDRYKLKTAYGLDRRQFPSGIKNENLDISKDLLQVVRNEPYEWPSKRPESPSLDTEQLEELYTLLNYQPAQGKECQNGQPNGVINQYPSTIPKVQTNLQQGRSKQVLSYPKGEGKGQAFQNLSNQQPFINITREIPSNYQQNPRLDASYASNNDILAKQYNQNPSSYANDLEESYRPCRKSSLNCQPVIDESMRTFDDLTTANPGQTFTEASAEVQHLQQQGWQILPKNSAEWHGSLRKESDLGRDNKLSQSQLSNTFKQNQLYYQLPPSQEHLSTSNNFSENDQQLASFQHQISRGTETSPQHGRTRQMQGTASMRPGIEVETNPQDWRNYQISTKCKDGSTHSSKGRTTYNNSSETRQDLTYDYQQNIERDQELCHAIRAQKKSHKHSSYTTKQIHDQYREKFEPHLVQITSDPDEPVQGQNWRQKPNHLAASQEHKRRHSYNRGRQIGQYQQRVNNEQIGQQQHYSIDLDVYQNDHLDNKRISVRNDDPTYPKHKHHSMERHRPVSGYSSNNYDKFTAKPESSDISVYTNKSTRASKPSDPRQPENERPSPKHSSRYRKHQQQNSFSSQESLQDHDRFEPFLKVAQRRLIAISEIDETANRQPSKRGNEEKVDKSHNNDVKYYQRERPGSLHPSASRSNIQQTTNYSRSQAEFNDSENIQDRKLDSSENLPIQQRLANFYPVQSNPPHKRSNVVNQSVKPKAKVIGQNRNQSPLIGRSLDFKSYGKSSSKYDNCLTSGKNAGEGQGDEPIGRNGHRKRPPQVQVYVQQFITPSNDHEIDDNRKESWPTFTKNNSAKDSNCYSSQSSAIGQMTQYSTCEAQLMTSSDYFKLMQAQTAAIRSRCLIPLPKREENDQRSTENVNQNKENKISRGLIRRSASGMRSMIQSQEFLVKPSRDKLYNDNIRQSMEQLLNNGQFKDSLPLPPFPSGNQQNRKPTKRRCDQIGPIRGQNRNETRQDVLNREIQRRLALFLPGSHMQQFSDPEEKRPSILDRDISQSFAQSKRH